MEAYSQPVGRFVRGLTLADIPQAVADKAKLVLLDTLGVALASSTMDFGAMVTRVAQAWGGPEEPISRFRQQVAAANAVLANGTLAHGLDYDDTLEEAIVHTGCCAGMTALASARRLARMADRFWKQPLPAPNSCAKSGLSLRENFMRAASIPPHSVLPSALLRPRENCIALSWVNGGMRLESVAVRARGSLNIWLTVPGRNECIPVGAAHGGEIATLLAREGFRGPEKVFEGTHGFFQSFGGPTEYHFEKLLELGKIWETPRLTFKSYPCGSISHPYMDCALKLRLKYAPAPEQIVEVICRTAQGPVHRLWEPLADKQRPASSYGAKFSSPYCIAVMLIRGRAGLEEFTDEAIHEPSVLALARKVRYELDSTIDYPRHFSGHVKIRLADGSFLEANQAHPRGGFEDPLPPEEIEAKFRANASRRLPPDRADQIIEAVARLEEMPNVTSLTDLLKP